MFYNFVEKKHLSEFYKLIVAPNKSIFSDNCKLRDRKHNVMLFETNAKTNSLKLQ